MTTSVMVWPASSDFRESALSFAQCGTINYTANCFRLISYDCKLANKNPNHKGLDSLVVLYPPKIIQSNLF